MFIMVIPANIGLKYGISSCIGNGIQKAFYDDPNVLYISLHVYQDGKFYPGGDEGDWDHCGADAGIGKYADPEICRSELCALIPRLGMSTSPGLAKVWAMATTCMLSSRL